MNIYKRLFLATVIPFGIIMGICLMFQYGFLGFVAGLFGGIFYGGFMSLILGSLHIWSVKRISYRKSKDITNVRHSRNIELQLSYDKAFNLCIESLKIFKKYKIKEENYSYGKIVAITGMTWKSWGEVISFDVHKTDNNRIQIIISSKPVLPTTLVDYGKNLENVERIVVFLKEKSEVI
jgi:hypothetical protein